MMNVNKRELKKISLDFRSLASRVINANYREVASIVAMLVAFIERTPLIKEYIDSCPVTTTHDQILAAIEKVTGSYGRNMLSTGATPEEEVAYTFMLLNILQSDSNALLEIGHSYCLSGKYKDFSKSFGINVLLPFANNINNYLTCLGIDMGMDDETHFNITVNGGQVNLSQDNSTINAVQNNNGVDIVKLQDMIADIVGLMNANNVSTEQANEIAEALNDIKAEITKSAPRKGIIRMLLDGVKNTAAILGAIPEINQKIQNFAEYITPFMQ